MGSKTSASNGMEPLGWIIEHQATNYLNYPTPEALGAICQLLPVYLTSLKSTEEAGLHTLCVIVTVYAQRHGSTKLPYNSLIGALEGISRHAEKWVAKCRAQKVQVSESLILAMKNTKPKLVALVARRSFLDIMGRDGFSCEDLDQLRKHFQELKRCHSQADQLILGGYLDNLDSLKEDPSRLAHTAKSHLTAVEAKLKKETGLDQKLLDFCSFVRSKIEKMRDSYVHKILPNGQHITTKDTPLTISSVISVCGPPRIPVQLAGQAGEDDAFEVSVSQCISTLQDRFTLEDALVVADAS